ncbi:MAG: AAA family ATPase, partial [Desulfobacterales bacterium]|nr:AAA family ATPase [Desulfobacterales bacterium]
PAIGHLVTSLDPAEAPNASAREELNKLNLSFEMGDNVMIYLDDIQHLNPELLQKFISLCDAQRKIEGVYKGKSKTYDLRGRKVVVVMAGNPYTESGEKFKIPDMLANRADTYNLGDIIGDNADAFRMSHLENALTSNTVLNKLYSRSREDVYAIIRIAETDSRDGIEFQGAYSAEEIDEMVSVMKKMIKARDVVLRVNQEYIHSAGQADEYRTEPPFKLQGSYRNMNRLAEKIVPIMNDQELDGLVMSHYENEAQTLTTGTEANLLKFKELVGWMEEEEEDRWSEIKRGFKRNLLFRGADEADPMSRVLVT